MAQRNFETAEAAAQALIDAAASNNTPTLAAIFGPQGTAIFTSGNPEQDKAEQDEFASIAKNRHKVRPDSMNPERMILSIGSEDWPFRVPIVAVNGQWHFEAAMSGEVMQARRIGSDELDAIKICAGYVGAQRLFAEQHGMLKYAQTLDELGGLLPREAAESNQAYYGYYFHVLTGQGPSAVAGEFSYIVAGTMLAGFGLVAWPADYGVTGIHTFIVNQDGVLYQKDLGKSGATVTTFNPDPTWKPVY
jgi:hypothetical protein